jgi:hypothetical protein
MGPIHPNPFTGQAPHKRVEQLKNPVKFSDVTNRHSIARLNEAKRKAEEAASCLTPAQKK